MHGKPIPIIPFIPGMGLSSLTAQKGHAHMATTQTNSLSLHRLPLPALYSCPICSGLKSALDQNCPPCTRWAHTLFAKLTVHADDTVSLHLIHES